MEIAVTHDVSERPQEDGFLRMAPTSYGSLGENREKTMSLWIGPARVGGLVLLCSALAQAALANDFPTSARVLYVNSCIVGGKASYFEMLSKCACALDELAEHVTYDDYDTMQTVVNAMTIGGERGNELRGNEGLKPLQKRYAELNAQAREHCFLNPQ